MERTWARIRREAGARAVENVYLRDMAIPGIALTDDRRLEVMATGLPLFRGVPLGLDTTMTSPLHADGRPWPKADVDEEVAIKRATVDKERTYPELVGSSVLRLVALACETGGRWSSDTADVVHQLAYASSRSAPFRLRASANVGYRHRRWSILSVVAQDSLAATAATLVDDAVVLLDGCDGPLPSLTDVVTTDVSGSL